MKIATIVLALSLCLGSAGCKTGAYVNHPGAINTFDSQTYDILVSSKAVIDQTKTDLANSVFAPAVAAKVKTVVNTGLVPAYNALDIAYQAYHAGATTSTAAVQVAITNLNNQTTALTSAKAGN